MPAVGELCVAKYSKDNKWCRARITSVREEELLVKWTGKITISLLFPPIVVACLTCVVKKSRPVYNQDAIAEITANRFPFWMIVTQRSKYTCDVFFFCMAFNLRQEPNGLLLAVEDSFHRRIIRN